MLVHNVRSTNDMEWEKTTLSSCGTIVVNVGLVLLMSPRQDDCGIRRLRHLCRPHPEPVCVPNKVHQIDSHSACSLYIYIQTNR